MSKKTPQIRFKGFTDDWEERKLKDVTERVRSNDGRMDLPTLTMSASSGWLDQKDRFSGDISGKEKKNYTLLKKGELSYNHGNSKLAKYGVVFSLTNYEEALVPRVYHSFKALENTSADFIEYMFSTKLPDRELGKLISSGARMDGLLNINYDDFMNIHISIPNYEEQILMSAFFRKLDENIALHQRKLDLLKEQKKGFLQKMFPKNGAKIPELRFEGFSDDWEERKLVSMTNYKNGKGHEDKQSTIGKLELINLNSISISGGLKHSGKFIDEADDTLQKDDLVMILSDVGHGDLLGRVALIPEDDRFVLNQRVALLRPNATADPQFLFSYINAHQYYFKAQGAGMSQLNISKGSVENFISFVPIIEEQKKIGTFFKQLDNTITLHQRKLDLLKEQKKGFLQKMFVS
ncbi:restriction endonuclease subunit S [Leuconostoc mesenteroides]|uniref:restriction endonuclease subunit S n=1 Tax=Leuconostoc mesenteroides TaxID=1245 RepID=UPI00235EB858|nr:restriction endonuclease subunit S [Leuconostoc mesenteroides]